MQVLIVRAIVLTFEVVAKFPGVSTRKLALMTVTPGSNLQLVRGHLILAPLLATTVKGAILSLAFVEAGIVTKQVPLFTPGKAQICPWTLTKCTVTLTKLVLGRLHNIYTTPVVLTVELLLSVTTALGPNVVTRVVLLPVPPSAGLGRILKKAARVTFTLLSPLATGPAQLPLQRNALAIINVCPEL